MRECDLVMKGGITSGVVYPRAVAQIAENYRLRSIGGTSAGAIAAAFAAAAEYRRQTSPGKDSRDGFVAVEAESKSLATSMKQLFQPSPDMQGLYELLIALVSAKPGERLWAGVRALMGTHAAAVVSSLAATSVTVGLAIVADDVWLGVAGALFWPLVLIAVIVGKLYHDVFRRLPANDFGMCPGLRQGDGPDGLTDWICRTIQKIAGQPENAVLTIGDLREGAGVELAAMTTDLSSRRPFQLPLRTAKHWFSETELRRLFPAHVVEYLKGAREPLPVDAANVPRDLYQLPSGDAFPVALVARMSLSFPGLISAVPLWRHDDGLKQSGDGSNGSGDAPTGSSWKLRRCLFSDGGISSNFPIHFFDGLLPSRPTFGISLTDFDEERHGDARVVLPTEARQPDDLPVRPVDSIPAFVGSIVDTAKDWQDTLQAMSTGYAERIVEIRLDPKNEGGLNLAMDETTIERLGDFGLAAGRTFVDFDFNEHRWRRSLSVLPLLERSFEGIANAWDAPAAGTGWSTLATVLTNHRPKSYARLSGNWRTAVLRPFVESLARAGRRTAVENATDKTGTTLQNGEPLPSTNARIRFVADADRRPKK